MQPRIIPDQGAARPTRRFSDPSHITPLLARREECDGAAPASNVGDVIANPRSLIGPTKAWRLKIADPEDRRSSAKTDLRNFQGGHKFAFVRGRINVYRIWESLFHLEHIFVVCIVASTFSRRFCVIDERFLRKGDGVSAGMMST